MPSAVALHAGEVSVLRKKKLAEAREVHDMYVCELCAIEQNSWYPGAVAVFFFAVHHKACGCQARAECCTGYESALENCALGA
jgi:hypothetical protein